MSNFVAGAGLHIHTLAIASGQSLSDAATLAGARAARIDIPGTFTGTTISFQASPDSVDANFKNLYKSDGSEYTITVAPGRSILLDLADFLSIPYLKVRSGTAGSPTAEAAGRSIVVSAVL